MLEKCGQRSAAVADRQGAVVRDRVTGRPALVGALLFVANLAVKVVALGVIPANRKPSTGHGVAAARPARTRSLGLVAFALFGSPRLDRRRQARQDQAKQRIRERTEEIPTYALDPALPPYVDSRGRR